MKGNGIRVDMSANGEPHASMIVNGMPLKICKRWEEDCVKNYHGIRWLKLWSEHLVAQNKIKERDELVKQVLEKVYYDLQEAERTPLEDDENDDIQVLSGNA